MCETLAHWIHNVSKQLPEEFMSQSLVSSSLVTSALNKNQDGVWTKCQTEASGLQLSSSSNIKQQLLLEIVFFIQQPTLHIHERLHSIGIQISVL